MIFKHELTARSISRAFPNNDLAVLNFVGPFGDRRFLPALVQVGQMYPRKFGTN
jgi:hypothetical protein